MIHEAWQSILDGESGSAASASADTTTGATPQGIAWLPELQVIAFEGADVMRFLQGYLTCDTTALNGERFQPAAICSLKGRVVVNGWCIAPNPEQVLFVIHETLFEVVRNLLQAYLRFSRTRLTDLRDERLVFGGLDVGSAADGAPIDAARRLFLCASIEAAERLWRAEPHLAPGAWQTRMIVDGIPLVSAATADAFLPQMLDLPALGAINFTKGCYLGQEVVARAQHRGQVKRHLTRLTWARLTGRGDNAPTAGAELTDAGGRNRGVVIQSAGGPQEGTCLAVMQDETNYPVSLDAMVLTPMV